MCKTPPSARSCCKSPASSPSPFLVLAALPSFGISFFKRIFDPRDGFGRVHHKLARLGFETLPCSKRGVCYEDIVRLRPCAFLGLFPRFTELSCTVDAAFATETASAFFASLVLRRRGLSGRELLPVDIVAAPNDPSFADAVATSFFSPLERLEGDVRTSCVRAC